MSHLSSHTPPLAHTGRPSAEPEVFGWPAESNRCHTISACSNRAFGPDDHEIAGVLTAMADACDRATGMSCSLGSVWSSFV